MENRSDRRRSRKRGVRPSPIEHADSMAGVVLDSSCERPLRFPHADDTLLRSTNPTYLGSFRAGGNCAWFPRALRRGMAVRESRAIFASAIRREVESSDETDDMTARKRLEPVVFCIHSRCSMHEPSSTIPASGTANETSPADSRERRATSRTVQAVRSHHARRQECVTR